MSASSFRSQFRQQCDTAEFRGYVKDALRNRSFLETLLRQELLKQQIKQHAGDKVKKMLPDLVRQQVTYQLPSLVSTQIHEHLPTILRNNYQMRTLFENHLKTMQERLSDAAREILDKIVQEPEYHQVNRAYFTGLTGRFEELMNGVRHSSSVVLEKIRTDFDQDTASLRSQLDQVETMDARIQTLLNSVQGLKKVTAILGGTCCVLAGAVSYISYRACL